MECVYDGVCCNPSLAAFLSAVVRHWLREVANVRRHGTTHARPVERLLEEPPHLQAIPAPWRGDIAAARPQLTVAAAPAERPVAVIERIEAPTPVQHLLAVYEQLLAQLQVAAEVAA